MRKWWGLKILYFLEKVNDLWLHAFSVPELGTCPHTWHTSLGADGDAARLLATMAREYRQELGFKNPMKRSGTTTSSFVAITSVSTYASTRMHVRSHIHDEL